MDFQDETANLPTAFSLPRFIPLLKQRIHVVNPFTRNFLVGWIALLDSIPDLELVTYLPEFLWSLLSFLADTNQDVRVTTQSCLDKFLAEIKRISKVRKGILDAKKLKEGGKRKRQDSNDSNSFLQEGLEEGDELDSDALDDDDEGFEEDWIPGQDVEVNYKEILEILTASLDAPIGMDHELDAQAPPRDPSSRRPEEENVLLESLRWIVEFMDICPEEVLPFTPKILANMLPAMASPKDNIHQAANRVNSCLMDYVVSLSDEPSIRSAGQNQTPAQAQSTPRLPGTGADRDGASSNRVSLSSIDARSPTPGQAGTSLPSLPIKPEPPRSDLDYAAAVNSLTLLFLNDHEATRVAALTWLIMLHRKAPRKVLAFNDGTFPALLKTLSDPSDAVVTKDLQLLSQISRNTEDAYFANFMVNLLQLFSTDRKLLETRGNLIIRQLCISLSPERIYRTLADCIEKEEDVEFASIMVQNLNNNLITAPQLADVRKRLRNLETKVCRPLVMDFEQ